GGGGNKTMLIVGGVLLGLMVLCCCPSALVSYWAYSSGQLDGLIGASADNTVDDEVDVVDE
ncbi:MAG: hypothetical protein AAFS10_08995, partial [Myxococcota bacterium]